MIDGYVSNTNSVANLTTWFSQEPSHWAGILPCKAQPSRVSSVLFYLIGEVVL